MANTSEWTVLEKLLLAQSVYKFGEDSWVQVARNLRQHNMLNRQPEFFSQKNCSLQYYLMIDHLESEMRQQSKIAAAATTTAAAAQDMPSVVKLARKLYLQRIDELKEDIEKDKDQFLTLISEIDALRSGRQDAMLLAELEKRKNAETPLSASESEEPLDPLNTPHKDDTIIPTVHEVAAPQGNRPLDAGNNGQHSTVSEEGRSQSDSTLPLTTADVPLPTVSSSAKEQTPPTQTDDSLSSLPSKPRSSTAPPPDLDNDAGSHKRRLECPSEESVKRQRIQETRTEEETTNKSGVFSRKLASLFSAFGYREKKK
ncbi:hypothetical protein BX666DRAFT_1952266 [Dichotomocladium elegans]|nr:hypothetical protein BX666DRAFT_1952266 [Dichotomocladium elegans]